MKTDALIAALATDARPQAGLGARLLRGLPLAVALSALALLLVWSLRADLLAALSSPALVKTLAPAALGLSALGLARGLSAPLPRAGVPALLVGALGLTALAAVLWGVATGGLGALTMHAEKPTLLTCIVSIPLLSALPLAAILWAMRQGAPASPLAAGAAGGLAAGALGAMVYSFHCPEDAVLFFIPAYGTMILVMTALGALLGARLLRW